MITPASRLAGSAPRPARGLLAIVAAALVGERHAALRSPAASSRAAHVSTRRRLLVRPSATTASPSAGGTTPNAGGASAVRVPAKYDATSAAAGRACRRRRRTRATIARRRRRGQHRARRRHLDPDDPAARPGGYPLIAMMHGCCAGNKTSWEATSFDAGGERWHYNNAWFASRGYVVINFTARGFVDGQNQRLDRRDAARLAPLRDQRLPAPRRSGRRRSVLQRQPAARSSSPAAPTAAASRGWRSPTRSGRAPAART